MHLSGVWHSLGPADAPPSALGHSPHFRRTGPAPGLSPLTCASPLMRLWTPTVRLDPGHVCVHGSGGAGGPAQARCAPGVGVGGVLPRQPLGQWTAAGTHRPAGQQGGLRSWRGSWKALTVTLRILPGSPRGHAHWPLPGTLTAAGPSLRLPFSPALPASGTVAEPGVTSGALGWAACFRFVGVSQRWVHGPQRQ